MQHLTTAGSDSAAIRLAGLSSKRTQGPLHSGLFRFGGQSLNQVALSVAHEVCPATYMGAVLAPALVLMRGGSLSTACAADRTWQRTADAQPDKVSPMGRWSHPTGTESPSSRGYGYRWVKLRQYVMRRDAGLCQVCAKQGYTTQATEVDHITPKASCGTDSDANLQAICRACHADKTIADAGGTVRQAIGVDGWPIPLGGG